MTNTKEILEKLEKATAAGKITVVDIKTTGELIQLLTDCAETIKRLSVVDDGVIEAVATAINTLNYINLSKDLTIKDIRRVVLQALKNTQALADARAIKESYFDINNNQLGE